MKRLFTSYYGAWRRIPQEKSNIEQLERLAIVTV